MAPNASNAVVSNAFVEKNVLSPRMWTSFEVCSLGLCGDCVRCCLAIKNQSGRCSEHKVE
jgi:hypothetical protein